MFPLLPQAPFALRWLGIGTMLAGVSLTRSATPDPAEEFFEQRIRPILVDKCYKCHSRTSEKIKGGLVLDSREGLLKGGDDGPVVVAGDPETSRLIEAVRYQNKDLQMPPKERLTDSQIADFVTWVKAGAVFPQSGAAATNAASGTASYDYGAARKTWSFRPLSHPVVPIQANERDLKSPIDHFILENLREKGLTLSPPADKRTLIRRATFDLIGLPPTPEEIDAFLRDDSPDAFSRIIDRLLGSPHYGERWGRHWLDVVRYTDSFDARGIGGEADVPEAYRYRDWVVDAFNRDLPYDEFVVEQIAGDLLATDGAGNFDPAKLIATGVMAIGEWGTGDADKEKMLTDIVDDQIDVTGRAFLGLTLACARCHDHKFDPIPTEDYYSLAGIYFSSHILPSPGLKTAGSPVLRIPLASLESLNQRTNDEARAKALDREINGIVGAVLLDKPTRGAQNNPALTALNLRDGPSLPSAIANSGNTTLEFITITLPVRSVAVHPSPDRAAAVAWQSPIQGAVAVRGRVSDADDKCGNGIEWTLYHGSKTLQTGQIDNGGSQEIQSIELDVKEGDLLQLAIFAKNRDHSCDTTVVELEIGERREAGRSWHLPNDVVEDLAAKANTGVWYFLAFNDTPPVTLAANRLPPAERDALETKKRELSLVREKLSHPVPLTHGLQEGGVPQSAHAGIHDVQIHIRGRYDRLGKTVPRRFPRMLAGEDQSPIREGSGRMQLAKWIASADNPLTARVMMNRIWQRHFGEGLVRTPNNFGKLGEPPANPELLDFLASEFIRSGWSIKAMHRAIMLSAVYQQASSPRRTAQSEEASFQKNKSERFTNAAPESIDPDNRLFWRMNRRRLEAEPLRDSLLALAGNLDRKMEGPAIRDLDNRRRTLYLMTIRSDRSNYRMLFDAPDPVSIAERRVDSTVAPQALFLLNHPFVLAQIKLLVQRLEREAPSDDRGRIEWLYKVLYGRSPNSDEVLIGVAAVTSSAADQPSTMEAWQRYCQALVCANEFVYVD